MLKEELKLSLIKRIVAILIIIIIIYLIDIVNIDFVYCSYKNCIRRTTKNQA